MSDDLKRLQQQLAKKVAGLTPVEKHIILLKLTDLYENQPEKFGEYGIGAGSPEREWLSDAGALIKKYDQVDYGSAFKVKMMSLNRGDSVNKIIGIVSDVIAAIRLELELDGRSEIGSVYGPGQVYEFFSDLKDIIKGADRQIFLIEPYLTGEAFDKYFGGIEDLEIHLLVSKSATEVEQYAGAHMQQYKTSIEVRKSKEIHDRLIVVDRGDVWTVGGSLNQKGDKATLLSPLTPGVAQSAIDLYSDIWDRASPV